MYDTILNLPDGQSLSWYRLSSIPPINTQIWHAGNAYYVQDVLLTPDEAEGILVLEMTLAEREHISGYAAYDADAKWR